MGNDPFLVNSIQRRPLYRCHSYRWISPIGGGIATSIFSLIILSILLAISITVLVIGTRYRDPRYCPLESHISLYLIVHGSVLLVWIVFMILMVLTAIFIAAKNSTVVTRLAIMLTIVLYIILIFLLIWLIIGSVWTFRVNDRVIHEYDTVYNFDMFYCHPVLYKFTFIYLIISYVLIPIQCCFLCLNSQFHRMTKYRTYCFCFYKEQHFRDDLLFQ
jgi:hypothetical protein